MRLFLAAFLTITIVLTPEVLASGMVSLKKIQVLDGNQVVMQFDAPVAKSQVKLDYINDIIQISLDDVSVYPAKIFSVTGPEIAKVFAYQYSPKLVRARITIRGKAEDFKSKVSLTTEGKQMVVKVGSSSAKSTPVSTSKVVPIAKESAVAPTAQNSLNSDEQVLLENVLKHPATKGEETSSQLKPPVQSVTPLTGRKSDPSWFRVFGSLMVVFLLLGVLIFGIKKLRGEKFQIGNLLKAKLGNISGKAKLIDISAIHHLGPKKSICVAKVCGRTLVLGVTNDSINLIAQFSGDGSEASVNAKNYEDLDLDSFMRSEPPAKGTPSIGATSGASPYFSEMLKSEATKPNVRAQIRSKVEGLKQL
jgi:flagellar biogenesis protein FliO